MNDPDTEREPVEVLADEFIERRRRGETPTIKEYADQFPDLADEIRAVFPAAAAVERLKAHRERTFEGHVTLCGLVLRRLGDFRMIREIGRGGMGIVYEVEQESLDRRVAVKVLPKQLLRNPKHRERFEAEAQTAGKLHHTNIVPVFGVGHHDGFHYIVMQFIQGIGLERMIARLRSEQGWTSENRGLTDPFTASGLSVVVETLCQDTSASTHNDLLASLPAGAMPGNQDSSKPNSDQQPARKPFGTAYWQSVARIGLQVAQALAYAHSQGTVHCDIKPSNLLISSDGTVWVADFGLATAIQSAQEQPDIAGTLRYMAPEQFAGRSSAASDLYSLGLTLFELVTLRAAIADRQPSREAVPITRQEVPDTRKLNPAIPRDLSAIIHKVTRHDVANRYASATELAADLQRYLDGRPIRARSVSPVEHLWRWSRRNPALAMTSGMVIGLLVAIFSINSLAHIRTTRSLSLATTERDRAEGTLDISLEALDKIYQRFAPARVIHAPDVTVDGADGEPLDVPTRPMLSPETAALLQDLLEFYDRFSQRNSDNFALQIESAVAHHRMGDIYQRLGQYDTSEATYKLAIDKFIALGDEVDHSSQIAAIYTELGNTYAAMRAADRAGHAYDQALNIHRSRPSLCSDDRLAFARTLYLRGQRPSLGSRNPGGGQSRQYPGGSPNLSSLDEAIGLLSQAPKDLSQYPETRFLLALSHRDRWPGLHTKGASRAIEILEDLCNERQSPADYRYELCETYAMFDVRRRSFSEEEYRVIDERLRKAMVHSQQLVASHPNVPAYAASKAQIHLRQSIIKRRIGRNVDRSDRRRLMAESEDHVRLAIATQASLVLLAPDEPLHRVWLAKMHNRLAEMLRLRGDLQGSRSILKASTDELEKAVEMSPEHWSIRAALCENLGQLAELLVELEEHKLATEVHERATRHTRLLPKRDSAEHVSGTSTMTEVALPPDKRVEN